jgi:hypothetical protein
VRSISRGRFAGYVDASFLPQKQLRLGDSGQVIGRKQWCVRRRGVLTLVVDPSVVWLDLAVAVVMSGGERGWRDDHGLITKCPGYKFNQNSKRIRSPASLSTFIHSFIHFPQQLPSNCELRKASCVYLLARRTINSGPFSQNDPSPLVEILTPSIYHTGSPTLSERQERGVAGQLPRVMRGESAKMPSHA